MEAGKVEGRGGLGGGAEGGRGMSGREAEEGGWSGKRQRGGRGNVRVHEPVLNVSHPSETALFLETCTA